MALWFYGILFVALVVAVSVGGMLLIHRYTKLEFLETHNEVAGFIYAVVGVVYAVLLTFVISFVWEQHEAAEERVEAEANTLGNLYSDTIAFAPREQVLRSAIRTYVQAVKEDEWQTMIHGASSPEAWRAYNRLWLTYINFVPENDKQRLWYKETISDLNDVGNARRLRLLSNHATVPSILWAAILLGGVVTVTFGYFFGTKNRSAHILMVVAVSGVIALNLYIVYALDHPFRSLAPVSFDSFNQLEEIFNRWS